jgi:hypothetical protein
LLLGFERGDGVSLVRVIEEVSIQNHLDPWLSLPALSMVSGLSVCTLRRLCAAVRSPLPHFRLKEPHAVVTKDGKRSTATGKILVRWSEFERWMEQFHHRPAQTAYDPALDVDRLVDEVVNGFRA